MIIDSHLHVRFTKEQDWDWKPAVQTLLRQMENAGIERTCAMSSARYAGYLYANRDDMRFQADTLAEMTAQHPGRFYPLMHINPLLPLDFLKDIVREYVVEGPIIGVKFSITMFADDKRLDPFYDFLEEHDIPMLFHSWYKTVQRYPLESTPAQIANAARKHPSLRILMAHVTGVRMRGILDIKQHPNIVIDTSGSQPEDGYVQRAIEELGADRVLFGSDYPIRAFSTSLARIDSVEMSQADRGKILSKNALNFYRKGVQA